MNTTTGGPPDDRGSPVAVDVWLLDLDDRGSTVGNYEQILSAPERARAHALTAEPHGRRYASSRVQLRQLLGAYLGIQPADVRFACGEFGKPVVVAESFPRLRFNSSRSAGTGLVAVQQDGIDVGVDVETIRAGSDLAAVADRFFPAHELARLAAMPPGERARARYDCWTRIEAELKGIGTGLTPSRRPSPGPNGGFDGEPTRSTGLRPDWMVCNVAIAPDISAAVAAHVGAGSSVRTQVRPWEVEGP